MEVKKEIRHAISQSKNVKEWNGHRYITFQFEPSDLALEIIIGEQLDYAQKIIDSLPEKYKDHLIGVKDDDREVAPIFEEPYQEMWDKEREDYFTRKGEWCSKHGCD